jgi:hypothetical protein
MTRMISKDPSRIHPGNHPVVRHISFCKHLSVRQSSRPKHMRPSNSPTQQDTSPFFRTCQGSSLPGALHQGTPLMEGRPLFSPDSADFKDAILQKMPVWTYNSPLGKNDSFKTNAASFKETFLIFNVTLSFSLSLSFSLFETNFSLARRKILTSTNNHGGL